MPCRGRRRKQLEVPPNVASRVSKMGGYSKLLARIPSDAELRRQAKVNHALSDLTRTKILWALARTDLCPCLLREITGVPSSKLSYHLQVLERTELIRAKKRRTWRTYSMTALGRRSIG